jgi:hypothetical protein
MGAAFAAEAPRLDIPSTPVPAKNLLDQVPERPGETVTVNRVAPGSPTMIYAPAHLEKFHDEDFYLNPHYTSVLEECMEKGSPDMKWVNGFTMVHFAVKKHDKALLQFLLNPKNGCKADIHAIDDFGKKAIDYCDQKHNFALHAYVKHQMAKNKPLRENAEKEADYKIVMKMIAAGEWDPKHHSYDLKEIREIQEKKNAHKLAMEKQKSGAGTGFKIPDNVAGANPGIQIACITQYECEQQIPAEYKKLLKKAAGGWESCKTSWPNGESLLHWAARHNKEDVAKFCVFILGADIKEEDPTGKDAIQHAKLKKHRKLHKQLVDGFKPKGAEILRNSAGEILYVM